MFWSSAPRIVFALVATIALTLVAIALGAANTTAVIVLAAGMVVSAIFMLGHDAQAPIAIREASEPAEAVEARIIEAISEPVLQVIDGRVTAANGAALALLGDHIIGEDVRLAIRHPGAAERLSAHAADGAVELVGLGGRDQRIKMQIATIAPGRRVIHLIDQTTSYAAERARVDFVANASHELRTPLSAILGFIETLDDEKAGGDTEVRGRFLSVMFKEARRMQRLIDDLISLSRIEAEKYQVPAAAVALPQLVEEVVGELRDDAGRRRADLVVDFASDGLEVTGDRAQLSQVVHNLVGNSIKYGRTGAPVTIGLKRDGNLIRLSVTDLGDGISPEHLPRLTERFYRVDSGRSRSLGGTGLGLAIVKHIVERHRGRLDITSRVGQGTTVSITLPAASKALVT